MGRSSSGLSREAADAALLARLRRGNRGDDAIGPYVWRAGDRDLTAAEPVLWELFDAPPPSHLDPVAWQHSLVSALVRCATRASIARLDKLVADARTAPHVRNIARLAIVRVEPARALELARPLLPPALAAALDRRDPAELAHEAEQLLVHDPAAARGAAVALYLIDTAAVPAAASGSPYRATGVVTADAGERTPSASVARAAVLAIARVARLSNAEAATVRALFRLAELRRDAELYVRLARRIDQHKSPIRPFGPKARRYIRRRVARVLRRLARAESPDYVVIASDVLLSVTDADAGRPRQRGEVHYDRFATLHAFNDILYGASPRYERAHHDRSVWRCRGGYRPGDPAPAAREERYAALWDRTPAVLWRVLVDADNLPAIAFAARALRDHRAYVDALPNELLAGVLAHGRQVAQQLAFDMVRDRPMTITLARAGLASDLPDANAWVLAWIDRNQEATVGDPELLALLLTGKTAPIRQVALDLLRGRVLPAELAHSVAARTIAILVGMTDADRAAAVVGIVLRTIDRVLAGVAPSVLRDLISHPLAALGELAGELLLRHGDVSRVPFELVEALLGSPHAPVRTLGGRLLALTPPEVAAADLDALVAFATSGNRELRDATRALIGAVAARFPAAGQQLADRLLDGLLRPQPEGAPAHMAQLLRGELAGCLPRRSARDVLALIGALSLHARSAGGLLLSQLEPDELGLDEIARLASHEILAIRQGAWALARAALPRFRLAPVALAKLVDSGWDDTREFAAALLRDDAGALSADAVIAICDSIRPEVQAIGKQLLRAQLEQAQGGHYVVRLAEHPSTAIQLLVSELLDAHVAGQLDRLRALVPYLITVLSQVNRGKVAKQRVIALLRREAARSAEAAAIIAPILERQSATAATSQKHPLIATMVDVRARFPEIALPITVIAPGKRAP